MVMSLAPLSVPEVMTRSLFAVIAALTAAAPDAPLALSTTALNAEVPVIVPLNDTDPDGLKVKDAVFTVSVPLFV